MNGTTPNTTRISSVGASNSQPMEVDRIHPLETKMNRGGSAPPRQGGHTLLTITQLLELGFRRFRHLVEGIGRAQLSGDRLVEERRGRFAHLGVERIRRRAGEQLAVVLHQREVA